MKCSVSVLEVLNFYFDEYPSIVVSTFFLNAMMGVVRFLWVLVLSCFVSAAFAEESPSLSPTIQPSLSIQNTSSPSIAPSPGE